VRIEPTESQRQVRERVQRWLRTTFAPGDAADGDVARRETWRALVGSGLVRLTLPIPAGGLGQGLGEGIIASEEMGRFLVRSPHLETVTVAELIAEAGPGSPHWPLLESIQRGHCVVTLPLGGPDAAPMTAENGRLSGTVDLVRFAATADVLVVRVSRPAGDTLELVPTGGPGIELRRHDDMSGGDLCRVTLTGVEPGAPAPLCAAGSPLVAAAMTRARTRHAAHLLGTAQGAFDLTLRYTKQRQQFGQRIAAFQHIAFRLSALAARLEAARLLVQQAAWLSDRADRSSEGRSLAALALVADLARDVTAESLQLYGAAGLTETAEAQRYYRRAAVDGLLFGTGGQLRAAALGALRRPGAAAGRT
jgi:alkylation response protein AidB-like acyl-CoA dehydrogenase